MEYLQKWYLKLQLFV